jgi:two-component system phosphate regulon sensor histidine kinase PhoR
MMKTRAFIVRILLCLVLSLIPMTDLENFFYSTRFEVRDLFRSHSRVPSSVLIVEVPSFEFQSTANLRLVQNTLKDAVRIDLAPRSDSKTFITDPDGVVRSAPGKTGRPIWIDFLGPVGSIPRCTLDQVQHLIPGCETANRNLLLVDDIEDTIDLRTPVGKMSRAEVIANEWNTALSRPVYRVSYWLSVGMIFAMVPIVAFYILYYPVIVHAIAVVGTGFAIVFFLFQVIFQYFNVYIPAANLSLSILITYLIFSGYRLAFQENLQWRSDKQAEYLRELDQMKTNFLSLMSHDLKTPIAKIQAVAERLRRELQLPSEDRSDWKELIESIDNSNNELKHYITSILNLSKIESRKVILNKKSNDINVLIRQVLKRLAPLAQQKGIQIEERLDPLFSVECDEDLMRQVISNLVDNAIKYSPSQSRVVVESREQTEGGTPVVRVSVQDFGRGISKDQLPQMFRKFSRLAPHNSEVVKGSGLGLYLSKYFIELHGGSIRVESGGVQGDGAGTTFSFTLPIELIK